MRFLVFLSLLTFIPGYSQPSATLDALLAKHRADPSNPNICQQIGVAFTQSQEFDKAETFFREAVRLNPQFWAARKNLATVLWFLDRKAESEREFQEVTRVLPADPVPHLYLGLAAHARRDFANAKMQFEAAGELASDNPEIFPALLESLLATSDWKSANALLVKMSARHEENPEGWRMLAEAYDGAGKPDDAYRAFHRALEADPASEETYVALAEFASAHGNDEYALKVVAQGLARRPQSGPLYFEQGLLWAWKGDRIHAEAAFQKANSIKPDWAPPLMALGVSKMESGDAGQATAEFQKARTADPGDYRTHFLYATALTRDAHDSAQDRAAALQALHQAIELNPKDARPYVLLGQLDPDGAEADWQMALKIDPENATALYELGRLYQKRGKSAEAQRLLEKFRAAKAKMHGEEDSLVQILRVIQRPAAASDSSTRSR